ncbi:MAG TPA: M48 family metallopeptidase [Sphingomicrobium sp.]|nr:M48 family metallopeptidase [Sphingomicrobium sp.]
MMSDWMMTAAAAATANFNVEAATRAYLDTLQGAARAKSDAYFEGGYWLILWGTLVALVTNWITLHFGWSAAWSRWTERVTNGRVRQAALYAIPFTLVGALLALPWTIYTGYFREKQYDLLNQNFGAWSKEQAIALAVSLVITAIMLAVIFTVIRRSPKRWWLWGGAAMTAIIAVMVAVAPVFIAPLFNTYTPMAEGPLRTEILSMAKASNIPADNVYVFDASKQTKRISANVSGLGPTIRISLNDNLLNRTSPPEIKAVMGHEMGHYVLGHIFRTILYFSLLIIAFLLFLWWATPRILSRYGQNWGVRDVSDPAVTPLFAMVAAVAAMLATPLLNTIVRTQESEADAFGLDAAREPDGFALTAMKLSEYRKIEPSAFEEAIFFDHPSGRTRVHMAMEWKARHLAELPPEKRAMVVPNPAAGKAP